MELLRIDYNDISLMSKFFQKNFENRDYDFWFNSIQAIYHSNKSCPNLGTPGYFVQQDDIVIAGILVIYDQEKDSFSLSSWAVDASYRHLAYPFIRSVLQKLEEKTIYNHSAVAGVDMLMKALGFKSYKHAVVPLPLPSFGVLRFVSRTHMSDYKRNIKTIQTETGLVSRVKLLSVTRNNKFRRLALLIFSNRPMVRSEVMGCSFLLLLKGFCFVRSEPSFSMRAVRLKRFETMAKNIDDKNLEYKDSLSDLVYSGSEYEVMEF